MLLCCHDVLRLDCSGLSAGTALKSAAVIPSVAAQSDTAADSVHIKDTTYLYVTSFVHISNNMHHVCLQRTVRHDLRVTCAAFRVSGSEFWSAAARADCWHTPSFCISCYCNFPNWRSSVGAVLTISAFEANCQLVSIEKMKSVQYFTAVTDANLLHNLRSWSDNGW